MCEGGYIAIVLFNHHYTNELHYTDELPGCTKPSKGSCTLKAAKMMSRDKPSSPVYYEQLTITPAQGSIIDRSTVPAVSAVCI